MGRMVGRQVKGGVTLSEVKPIQSRAALYLQKKIKQTSIFLERSRNKPKSDREINDLKNKLEILMYLKIMVQGG